MYQLWPPQEEVKGKKIVKYFLLLFGFIILVGIVFWGVQWFSDSVKNLLIHKNSSFPASLETSVDSAQASALPKANSQSLLPLRNWQIEQVMLGAQSAVSVEFGTGPDKVLFQKNEEVKLPVASLSKLMTALVVLDNYNVSTQVTIDSQAMAQEGEQGDLKLGQTLSVKNLLYITLMESSNRSAYALSEVMGTNAFIALMNTYAQKMGLANTHFEDVTGLDAKSYSTAKDLATLSQYLFENYPLFKEITGLKTYNLMLPDGTLHHTLANTNILLGQDNIISGKTGFTNDAKGCVMVIQKSPQTGNYLVNIVLGTDDRFGDMQKLVDWLTIGYTWQ